MVLADFHRRGSTRALEMTEGGPPCREPVSPETKLRHAEEFLDKGNKLKIQLQFRGRENAHKDLGMVMMDKIKKDLETMAQVDMPAKLVGRAIGMTMGPLPANKRKRRFAKIETEYVEDDDDDSDHDDEELPVSSKPEAVNASDHAD